MVKNIGNTIQKLKAFILNDSDFRDYYKAAKQQKNLNGFQAFVSNWLNHLKNNPQYIALLDKRYLDCSYKVINGNIIDLDSLYLDYCSDLKAFFNLNPESL